MKKQYKIQYGIAIFFIITGIGCFLIPKSGANIFYWGMTILVTLSAAALICTAIKNRTLVNWGIALTGVGFAAFLWLYPHPKYELILIIFAAYMFLLFLCELIQWILDLKDHSETSWSDGLTALLYLAVSICAFIFRKEDLKVVMDYFGIYLILQSVQSLLELHVFTHPRAARRLAWQKWIALPVYFVSFLPGLYLRHMLKSRYGKEPLSWDERKNDEEVNLRVYIHTGLSGEHLVGHMTFSYKGIMYSYGDYDRPAEKFFHTIGPGILFTVDAEVYVNNCCLYEQDTIFEYGLHLNEKQEALLVGQLNEIEDNLIPWQCQLEKSPGGRKNWPKYSELYADRLWYRTDCHFNKFKKGQWKTYWILDNNCTTFAQSILSRIGCEIPAKSGIVSPGEYWEFFETWFEDPKSIVITRSWHDGTKPETLFDVKQPY